MSPFSDTVARSEEYEARKVAVKVLSEQGYSLRQIGQALSISHEWVRKLLFQTVNS